MTNTEQSVIIAKQSGSERRETRICECAGTGRQARLRGVCRTTYGFKSRHSHHLLSGQDKVNRCARVVELADSLDSGSSVQYARAGSSPASRTSKKPCNRNGYRVFLVLVFLVFRYFPLYSSATCLMKFSMRVALSCFMRWVTWPYTSRGKAAV